MVNELRYIDLFFTKHPVFRGQDKIGTRQFFNDFGVTPFHCLHCRPVNVLSVFTTLQLSKLAGSYRVTYPEHELAILVVGNLSGIHPESTYRNGPVTGTERIGWILITWTHMECPLWYVHHARRFGQSIP